jgi:hypothetical protein
MENVLSNVKIFPILGAVRTLYRQLLFTGEIFKETLK